MGWQPAARGRSKESGKKGWKEVRVGSPQHGKKPRVWKEGLEGGAGWQPAAREEAKSPERRVGRRCRLGARSTGRSQKSRKKGWNWVRAGRPQHGKKPRVRKKGLEGLECGLHAHSKGRSQESREKGWKGVRAGHPQHRKEVRAGSPQHGKKPRVQERRLGRRCGLEARTKGRSQKSGKKGWKEVRAGRPQHGKKQVPKERLEGGAGWPPAAREEAKCGLDARSTGRSQESGKKGWKEVRPAAREEAKSPERRVGRRRRLGARSTGRSQESRKKGWNWVRAGRPQHGKKPRVRKEGLEGVQAGRPQHGKKPRVPKEGLEGGAGWPPAAREEASPERRAGRGCGLAARSTERSQESRKKGWKEVRVRAGKKSGKEMRAGSPQHEKKPRARKEGLEGGAEESGKKGWKEVRAGRPQHGKKPRVRKEGLEGGAGWQPAAREEAKSLERRVGRRCGLAARSTGRSQESGKKGWKEVRAGSPQHGKKPRVRKEGLEAGAGWQPAAREEAKSPERRVGRRCGLAVRSKGRSQESGRKGWKEVRAGSPQHGKKPRVRKEGLEGGAGWQPAAREEAKSTGRSQESGKKGWKEVRAGSRSTGRKSGKKGCKQVRAGRPQHGKKPRVRKEAWEGPAWSTGKIQDSRMRVCIEVPVCSALDRIRRGVWEQLLTCTLTWGEN